MKQLLMIGIFFSSFLCIMTAHAQEDNPFKSIGKKAKVHTLSRGKYVESFDMDSIQRVGSVLINIRTREIVALLDTDSLLKKASDNSSASRWYSIDPLADKFANWSPYHFSYDNPVSFKDPDGRAAEWVPDIQINKDKNGKEVSGQIVVKMEKGDNAKTLSTYLGVDAKKAEQLMSTMSKDGTIKLTNDVPGVAAINASVNDMITNSDNYSHNFFTANQLFESNYNCWTCALSVTQGQTPDFSNVTSESGFVNDIKNNYTNVSNNPSQFRFGKTAISFGFKQDFGLGDPKITHGAVYLGTSRDGTVYVWTKDGMYYPPRIATLNATTSKYDPVMGVNGEKDKGYYNPVR
ncbi:hypothetical protein CLV59_103626 [Chitinophaga dinghuensis]|uniref:RHS repeat-associated protein n=1 Tax=Chitinophaga dinghuensis TaxID=1539050 RepID=A0A327W660_9BACT|nr:hypothetical protein [Chitinophaga dinghuensis]RAJ83655.1 hypothetical protein CLV59_103626 [Chitinophaga dinghuensis]